VSYKDHFTKLKNNSQASSQSSKRPVPRSHALGQKKKRKFPAVPLVSILFLVICGGWIFSSWDQMVAYLEEVEIFMLGQLIASSPSAVATAEPSESSSKQDWSHFANLQRRLQEIEKREKELSAREEEIRRMERELESNLAELTKVREEITKMLSDRKTLDEKNLGALVQMYSSMRPAQAAKVFEGMSSDLVIQILQKMKKSVAGEIMNMLSTERAKHFSERLMGLRDREVSSDSASSSNTGQLNVGD
jgi:flagellar motility protein MotE (MotC chaperone)